MKCIICRKEKNEHEFSDEHVIPDSINGYYHIYSVCKECNSKLGTNIDSKLVNHKFTDFQREQLRIEGKSGTIPNPFEGTHTLKDDLNQKVTMTFNGDGQLIPKLLPKTNFLKSNNGVTNISLTLDKRDLSQKDAIIQKMLKRHSIDVSKVTIEEQIQEYSESPWIQATMQIDIRDFKIGLLKIAYEFTVDTITKTPYFNDPFAISISKILYDADLSKMEQEITFLGDGLNKAILQPFANLINFENKNHYLILTQCESIGLICFVNIFDCFAIGIKMSELSYIEDNVIVGINDMRNNKFEKMNLSELLNKTYSPMEYRFAYYFSNDFESANFLKLQNDINFDFYKKDDKTPFFNKNGDILYLDIGEKINQPHLKHIHKGDIHNDLITEVILDEELYIKICPSMNLIRVVSVQLEQHKISRL